jgi:hypothetical protein
MNVRAPKFIYIKKSYPEYEIHDHENEEGSYLSIEKRPPAMAGV